MQITRPIVFFDLETTGINIVSDRIVQIGAIKILPNGNREEKDVLINPSIPIPQGATAVHGISDDDVKDKPLFRQIARSLLQWLEGCDLAGYNSDNFDVPLLSEEFARLGIDYPTDDVLYIDVIRIERLVNSHKLGDTYQRYLGEPLEDAHDALVDVKATLAIFEKQVELNPDLQIPMADIKTRYQKDFKGLDFARKLYQEDGQVYWNFGKHKGSLVSETLAYAKWVLNSDFSLNTKKHIQLVIDQLSKEK